MSDANKNELGLVLCMGERAYFPEDEFVYDSDENPFIHYPKPRYKSKSDHSDKDSIPLIPKHYVFDGSLVDPRDYRLDYPQSQKVSTVDQDKRQHNLTGGSPFTTLWKKGIFEGAEISNLFAFPDNKKEASRETQTLENYLIQLDQELESYQQNLKDEITSFQQQLNAEEANCQQQLDKLNAEAASLQRKLEDGPATYQKQLTDNENANNQKQRATTGLSSPTIAEQKELEFYQFQLDEVKTLEQLPLDDAKARFQSWLDKEKALYQLQLDDAKALYQFRLDEAKARIQFHLDSAKALYQLVLDKEKARYQSYLDEAKAQRDAYRIQIQNAQSNDNAQTQSLYTAHIAVAKEQLDRIQSRAGTIITAASAIGTLYTAVIALAYGVAAGSSHIQHFRGVVAAIFLGGSIVTDAFYLGYIIPTRKKFLGTIPLGLPSLRLRQEADDFTDWTNEIVQRNLFFLQASIIFLTLGVISLPLAFLQVNDVLIGLIASLCVIVILVFIYLSFKKQNQSDKDAGQKNGSSLPTRLQATRDIS